MPPLAPSAINTGISCPVLKISAGSRSKSIPFIPAINSRSCEDSGRQKRAAKRQRQAAMDSGSPVMTESERRAYRYAQAPRVQGLGVRKSWSNDSLFSLVGSARATVHSCVCAPTTHPGSFRCKHHRQNQNAYQIGGAGQSTADADADVKRGDEASPSAEQEKTS